MLKQQWAYEFLNLMGFKLHVSGEPERLNTLILVGNHTSYLDIAALVAVHPEVIFLAKSEVSRWPTVGLAAKNIGTLFIERASRESRNNSKNQIENTLRAATNNFQIAAFPSGTTTLHEEKPWKRGLFEVAQNTNTKIQPFRVKYSHDRECAYIDDDQLFTSMMRLFRIKDKTICFDWGTSYQVTDLKKQMEETQDWTKNKMTSTRIIRAEVKMDYKMCLSKQLSWKQLQG